MKFRLDDDLWTTSTQITTGREDDTRTPIVGSNTRAGTGSPYIYGSNGENTPAEPRKEIPFKGLGINIQDFNFTLGRQRVDQTRPESRVWWPSHRRPNQYESVCRRMNATTLKLRPYDNRIDDEEVNRNMDKQLVDESHNNNRGLDSAYWAAGLIPYRRRHEYLSHTIKRRNDGSSLQETIVKKQRLSDDWPPILRPFNLREWIAYNFPNRMLDFNDLVEIYKSVAPYTGIKSEEIRRTCHLMNEDFKRRQNLGFRSEPAMHRSIPRANYLMKSSIQDIRQYQPPATEIRDVESIPNSPHIQELYSGQSKPRKVVVPRSYTNIFSSN